MIGLDDLSIFPRNPMNLLLVPKPSCAKTSLRQNVAPKYGAVIPMED
jgi:hypothetical protein